jgi:lipopolysaccharide transport system ATP-binding protein
MLFKSCPDRQENPEAFDKRPEMKKDDTVIRVDQISKVYRIGLKQEMSDSLLRAALKFVKSPIANYRKYRSLYKFSNLEMNSTDSFEETKDGILWALRGISFQVKKGEVLGIIGSNGAGKSTLLKVLCKITRPTFGRAEINGRVSSLLEVGTGFHPELTGRENIYLNGTILGMRKREIDKKYDDIVAFSGVEKFIDTPVKRFSSGMKVRLAFSVAAHLEPEILIVDEVLAVGDADFQKRCLNKMEDIGKGGRTVLFVSHNMPAVTRLCSRAIYLDHGRVVRDGPSSEIVNTYLSGDSGTRTRREWLDEDKAPGNSIARLLAVRVKDGNNEISDSIDIRKSFSLEMEYVVYESGLLLLPHFGIRNEFGVSVFVTVDVDPEWRRKPRPKGRYLSKVYIPGNLLTEGSFFVNCHLMTLEPDEIVFSKSSIVCFTVFDSLDGNSARGDYSRNIPGVVRPLLKWKTERID